MVFWCTRKFNTDANNNLTGKLEKCASKSVFLGMCSVFEVERASKLEDAKLIRWKIQHGRQHKLTGKLENAHQVGFSLSLEIFKIERTSKSNWERSPFGGSGISWSFQPSRTQCITLRSYCRSRKIWHAEKFNTDAIINWPGNEKRIEIFTNAWSRLYV